GVELPAVLGKFQKLIRRHQAEQLRGLVLEVSLEAVFVVPLDEDLALGSEGVEVATKLSDDFDLVFEGEGAGGALAVRGHGIEVREVTQVEEGVGLEAPSRVQD